MLLSSARLLLKFVISSGTCCLNASRALSSAHSCTYGGVTATASWVSLRTPVCAPTTYPNSSTFCILFEPYPAGKSIWRSSPSKATSLPKGATLTGNSASTISRSSGATFRFEYRCRCLLSEFTVGCPIPSACSKTETPTRGDSVSTEPWELASSKPSGSQPRSTWRGCALSTSRLGRCILRS